jgi:DNA-binding NarL/FixJ family response regulator
VDPDVVSQLVRAIRRADGLGELTPREREVLTLMAEGRSNAGIAKAPVITKSVAESTWPAFSASCGCPVRS